MALIITRFTRFGANLGTLHVTDARHVEDLDGTDELTVTCKEDLSKGDYLVWRDQQGNWREHIVDVPERWRDEDGTVYTTALCINSIAETWDDWVDEVRPNGSAQVAMERVLASSRWSAGTCTQTGTAHRTFYHKSVRESLQGIVETWGGELETTITSDGTKVTGRSAAIVAARGNQSSAKRFTYTKDLLSIHRRVNSDNPKTRIYAYGRGEELDESGTYGRRIGIADVNGGIPYVEDTAATAIWGRYDASGNLMPAIGVFIDEECEDPATLKEEAVAYLQRVKEPSVTYEADVIDLAAFGREWEEVALGDTVTIVDKRFSDEGLRLHGRISRLERDLLTNDTSVTFGTLTDVLAGSWASMREQVGYLTERTAGVENVVNPSSGWLDQLISSLNSQYNAAGTYHYSSFEQGEIWSSVPLDENGHATQSGGWAININGMGFRLASSLNADGSWNWRTFGTGEGFTADEIVAGVIRGGQSYWNLNTGDFVISSDATIGGKAPDDLLTNVDVSVEQTSTGANITVNGDTVSISNGQDGQDGSDGAQILGITAAPSGYTTPTGGFTPVYRIALSTVKTQSGASDVHVGDVLSYSYYHYPVGYVDSSYVYCGARKSIRGATGSQGPQGEQGIQGPQGVQGEKGEKGDAGTSVTVSKIEYGTSTSAGTQPSSWSTTAPTSLTKGTWLWVKTTYSNGDSATTKSYVGTDGTNGSSISVSATEYQAGTSATTAPTGNWSTSPVTVAEGAYLWTRVTYSDGSKAYSVARQGANGTNGTNGTDGTSVTVKSVAYAYQLSTSGTTVPTGTWQTTPQAPTATQYAWTRTTTTFSDNNTAVTYTVGGKTGTSVTVSSIQYGTSDSASTAPSSWSTTAPTSVAQGKWLWVKTNYSNNTSATTKSYVGTDGEDGTSVYVKSSTKTGDTTTIVITDGTNDSTITIKDGEDGENGTNGLTGYVHTAWANSADGTVDFSTTVSAGKTYLGVYTDNTAADSTTPSAYSWSLIKGTGVTSLSPEYYLSTSSTGLAGGSWSAEQQEWQQGHYYWTRQKVTWTDGTTSYTDPVLESALNSANNCALSQHSSGTVINGSGCTIRSLTIHGKSVQDGTPTPSAPVAIKSVQGANLFDISTAVDGYLNANGTIAAITSNMEMTSDFIPVAGGDVMTLLYSVDNPSVNQPWICFIWYKSDQTVGGVLIRSVVSAGKYWNRYILPDTAAYVRVSARHLKSGNASVAVKRGYVPFSIGDFGKFYIESVGTNIADPSATFDYYINLNSTPPYTVSPSQNATSLEKTLGFYPVEGGESISLSVVGCTSDMTSTSTGGWLRYVMLGADYSWVAAGTVDARSRYSYTADSFKLNDPITVPSDARWFSISFRTYGGTPCIRLDGSTEYVPYDGITTAIDLQGNSMRSLSDGIEDKLVIDSEGNKTLFKRVGAFYADSSTPYVNLVELNSSQTARRARFVVPNWDGFTSNNIMSDVFVKSNNNASWGNTGLNVAFATTSGFFLGLPTTVTTVAEANAWIAANPFTILYPLAEPQTIPLGKIDLPSLPSPSFSMHVDALVTPNIDAEWWTVDGIASTGQLSQVASEAAERIGGLEDAVSEINNAGYATRAELEAAAAQLMPKDNDLFKWLRIVDSTLQIGRETTDGNRFYSSYTADGLGFYAGDSTLPVTALTRELGLYAPRSTIDEQLKIGGWAFIKRSNGNLTLKYIGG